MNKLILIIFLILIACPAYAEWKFADQWTKTDTALESMYAGLTIVDWGQTRNMIKEGGYHEINPLLGRHPSLDEVDILIPAAIVAHGLISMALPPKYRIYWQAVFIGIEGFTVLSNYNIGLRLDF